MRAATTRPDCPEITPAMLAAGTEFLVENADTGLGLEVLAKGVYRAMQSVAQRAQGSADPAEADKTGCREHS
jgi:hypothetical protein